MVRRRRRALGGVAAAALALGALAGGLAGESDDAERGGSAGSERRDTRPASPAERAVARMSLERQVGQLLVIAFQGTTAPEYVRRALRERRAAGVILFGGNAPSAASVRALTRRLQRAAGGDAIVSLDQEGGDIRTLAFAPSAEGQARQASPAAARDAATATARALRQAGVNVVLGPVADVAAPGSVMAGRAYPGDVAAVTAAVRSATRAYAAAGVAATLKHFPGLGAATTNTDDAPAVVAASRERLLAELAPYRGTPAPLVMVGHARYPALDPDRIASQSRAIVTGVLRAELGFDGVAITDSLEAEAVNQTRGGVGAAAVRSVAAGIDLLLMTGPGSFLPVRDALLARSRRSPAFRARVAEAAARVVALRRALR